ncbi:septum site-determining protein MinC [Pararobbsia silviterrae]|uniref:Probable septum site-determining protein MinC n=1 Tax=Pararobbsia silviterrae TaxID=1792498 RepID=A0A494Y7P5_9BURK|nr:septum site-determining protein MinC [Pararobbsia silviterrae]RKP56641.1 septum site-determining protein MinC [Pararobbsia silviterrae]
MSQKKTPYFELRSGSVDTLLFSVKTTDLDALSKELTRRFEATPEFFANDVVAIDVRRLEAEQRIDMAALVALLEQVRMRPIGVVAHDAQRAWAAAGSLPLVESRDRRGLHDAKDAKDPKGAHESDAAAPTPTPAQSELPIGEPAAAPVGADAASPSIAAADAQTIVRPTLVIDKPLRSGQQVYSKGDLVVLGLVSYGAEVIAEGNIHIYAPLRGRALAGVHGNHEARIFCTCLEPELISIAGIYRTTENALPADVLGKPVQVRLDQEKLLFETLRLN